MISACKAIPSRYKQEPRSCRKVSRNSTSLWGLNHYHLEEIMGNNQLMWFTKKIWYITQNCLEDYWHVSFFYRGIFSPKNYMTFIHLLIRLTFGKITKIFMIYLCYLRCIHNTSALTPSTQVFLWKKKSALSWLITIWIVCIVWKVKG